LKELKNEKTPGEVVMRDDNRIEGIMGHVLKSITLPEFYTEWSPVVGVQVVQGSFFIDKPHYMRYEQIMCAVEGKMNVALIPHVNR
jgi:hypothetical protein